MYLNICYILFKHKYVWLFYENFIKILFYISLEYMI